MISEVSKLTRENELIWYQQARGKPGKDSRSPKSHPSALSDHWYWHRKAITPELKLFPLNTSTTTTRIEFPLSLEEWLGFFQAPPAVHSLGTWDWQAWFHGIDCLEQHNSGCSDMEKRKKKKSVCLSGLEPACLTGHNRGCGVWLKRTKDNYAPAKPGQRFLHELGDRLRQKTPCSHFSLSFQRDPCPKHISLTALSHFECGKWFFPEQSLAISVLRLIFQDHVCLKIWTGWPPSKWHKSNQC